ncbi:hypothetical protein GCM10009836_68910 [Pseudonocardia ailaonensis]|uniref:Uncharacterized protein n=2 Tax=Pseudonocardia ailaonensis TaxID=367279 RepID=A0ABN2NQ86_9PSEU
MRLVERDSGVPPDLTAPLVDGSVPAHCGGAGADPDLYRRCRRCHPLVSAAMANEDEVKDALLLAIKDATAEIDRLNVGGIRTLAQAYALVTGTVTTVEHVTEK